MKIKPLDYKSGLLGTWRSALSMYLCSHYLLLPVPFNKKGGLNR